MPKAIVLDAAGRHLSSTGADRARQLVKEGRAVVTQEQPLTIRLNYEVADKGVSAPEAIADIIAPRLGWDDATRAREIDAYRQRAEAEFAAAEKTDDAAAQAARDAAEDLAPLLPIDGDPVRPGTKPGSSPQTPAPAGPAGT